MKIALIIPSLRPNKDFPDLIKQFKGIGFNNIIVVNDGSASEYNNIFEEVNTIDGCEVLKHSVNLGKGRALKTGFNYFLNKYPDYIGIVTADADGQHAPRDTFNVAKALEQNPDKLILGARDFDGEDVPKKSRFGNKSMSLAFKLFIGLRIHDTQTGLRGIPKDFLIPLMELKGERFEYETNMLIETKKHNITIAEEKIKTIYINNNESTHFNPIIDSLKVLSLIFKFVIVSIASFLVDITLFSIFTNIVFIGFHENLLYSTVAARLLSSLFNYTCNKNIVFDNKEKEKATIIKYYVLCVIQTAISWGLLRIISDNMGMNVTAIKAIVDTFLFFISFQIQREFVFKKKK
ncbi:MAG: glycosyltransferase [Clostridiales bacterium]|jgi:dolichol-phosphate mannosyltransferase|nr:glycosyltransferase [Clostridiales bacterium]